MSESTIVVPLTGSNVTPQAQAPQPTQTQERPASGFVNGQYIPPAERVTLHKTRLGTAMAQRAEALRAAAAATPAPTPQPAQAEALSRQVAALEAAVTALAASQLGNMQRGHDAPQQWVGQLEKLRMHNQYGSGPYTEDGQQYSVAPDQPDPLDHDFYDEASTADFHHLNNGYIERTVQQRLDAERVAQQKTAQDEDVKRQGVELRAKFGRDRNFDEAVLAACGLIIESGYKLPVEEAYLRASNELEAKNTRRGSLYLPKDVRGLGSIMRYNQETGRSRK